MSVFSVDPKEDELRVLLMVPPRKRSSVFIRTNYFPPIGLGYLASFALAQARQDKFPLRFTILDSIIEKIRFSDLPRVISQIRPDIVGVNFYTENRFDAWETIQIIKKVYPGTIVVGGGAHATLATDDTIRNFPGLDIIVRGEGEETFYTLLKNLVNGANLDEIPGISYKTEGQVYHNPDRPFLKDLDTIPFPVYNLLKMDRYFGTLDWSRTKEKMGMIITSRGCPYKCNFCSSAKAWGNRYRVRSPENIIEEIEHLKKDYQVSGFFFFDDTMTIRKTHALEICRKIIEKNLSIRWITHSRIDVMDEDLMKVMKNAGCTGIMFGVESGSQRIIDEVIKKKIKIEDVKKVSALGKKLGMVNNFSYIISHPTETMAEAELTVEMLKQHLNDNQTVILNIMRTYPGTEIETYALKHGLLPKDFSWSKKFDLTSNIVARTLKGEVPFFRDTLSWKQIYDINSRFLKMTKYPVYRHGLEALENIQSLKDIVDLVKLGFSYLRAYFF